MRATAEPDRRLLMDDRRAEVEAALRRCLDGLERVAPPPVRAAAAHALLGGGKRVRPLLLLAAAEELGGGASGRAPRNGGRDVGGERGPAADPRRAALCDLAASVEVIHAYSLIHDDLPCMDDAELRRGRPAVHIAHGVATAAATGVILVPWAAAWAFEAAVAAGRSPAQAREIAAILLEAAGAGGMVGGQALDLASEGQSLSEEELAALHRLKTGALLEASLAMGARAAAAPPEALAAAAALGRSLGLAFQVMDDVLDATSSAEALGKRPSDAQLGKSTYVRLLGVDGARARARQLIDDGLAALDAAGLPAPRLRQAARFVVERRR